MLKPTFIEMYSVQLRAPPFDVLAIRMRQVLKNVWDGVDLKKITNERDLTKYRGLVRGYFEGTHLARCIVNHSIFQSSITFTILVASVVVGVQTDEKITAEYPALFYWLEWTILWIFTVEITLKFIEVGL